MQKNKKTKEEHILSFASGDVRCAGEREKEHVMLQRGGPSLSTKERTLKPRLKLTGTRKLLSSAGRQANRAKTIRRGCPFRNTSVTH